MTRTSTSKLFQAVERLRFQKKKSFDKWDFLGLSKKSHFLFLPINLIDEGAVADNKKGNTISKTKI